MFTCLDEEMQWWDDCEQRNDQFMELQFLDRTEIYMKLKHEGKEHIIQWHLTEYLQANYCMFD